MDPAQWMRAPDPVGPLGVLQAAVFTGGGCGTEAADSARRPNASWIRTGWCARPGIWYLVADQDGEPRLFRVSRVLSAVEDEAAAQRRAGIELVELWETLPRHVEDRPAEVPVVARVRRERLDMFRRICASYLEEGGEEVCDEEWAVVRLRFAAVPAARTLLSFGGDVEVISPPEVRADLASVAAEVVARYTASNMRLGMR